MTRDIDWGIPVPLDGWRDNPTKRLYVWFDAVIGYLSASIEWARRTGDPERVARVVERPGGAVATTSWARTTSSSTRQIWPAELLGYNGEGDAGGEPGQLGELQPAHRGGLQRVPDDGGQAVLLLAAGTSSTSRDFLARYQPDALRYFICGGRPGDQDTDFTWAEFVPPQQRRAGRRLGQPGQPHRHDDRQELRRDPGRRRR